MCPACVANVTLMAASATSGGGLIAFLLNTFFKKKATNRKGTK
jgi:hypothetical protein